MGIKTFNPTSPGRRQMTTLTNDDLTKKKPEKQLTTYIKSSGGRNNQGRTSVRYRGGGHKKIYRQVDFKRNKPGVPARVAGRAYWEPQYSEPLELSSEEAAAELRSHLRVAVSRRASNVGGTGILLSGGLDSSTVAATAASTDDNANIRAYSAAFPEHPDVDESWLVDETVRHVGLNGSRVLSLPHSSLAGAVEFIKEYEVPNPSPNHSLLHFLSSKARADGVDVLMDGEGGDELWTENPYYLADLLRSGRLRKAIVLTEAILASSNRSDARRIAQVLKQYGVRGAAPHWVHGAVRAVRAGEGRRPSWLNERGAALVTEHDVWAWKRRPGPRWWAYLTELLTGIREGLVMREYLRRRAAMAGLESRHPLIDVDLMEFILRLSPELAIERGTPRPLIRRAMIGALSEPVRLKPHKSFFNSFIRDCLLTDFETIKTLLGPGAEIGAYVQSEAMRELLLGDPAAYPAGWRQWCWDAWRTANAEIWLRCQSDPKSLDELSGRLGITVTSLQFEPLVPSSVCA